MISKPLIVGVEECIDSEALESLEVNLAVYGDDAEVHVVPDKGPQASILLLSISSIALMFTGAFFAKLGHKAAEDSYPYIKAALSGT